MKDENFFVIQGWMVNKLKLSGNELMIFAIIFGFSQDGETEFKGTLTYLSEFVNCSTRSVMNIIKSLVDKGYIEKRYEVVNNVNFCRYKISGGVKFFQGGMENFSGGGGEKFSPNNNNNNIYNNKYMSQIKICDVDNDEKEFFQIAEAFRKLFIKNLQTRGAAANSQEKATYKNYVTEIRLMLQNNECTKEDLQLVFKFLDSPKGDFWAKNILSTKKLRKQIERLVIEAKNVNLNPKTNQLIATFEKNLQGWS